MTAESHFASFGDQSKLRINLIHQLLGVPVNKANVNPEDSFEQQVFNLTYAYRGKNQHLGTEVRGLVLRSLEWQETVVPFLQSNNISYEWDSWEYNIPGTEPVPPEAPPPEITSSRTKHVAWVERFAQKFRIDMEFLGTPDGVKEFGNRLRVLGLSILKTRREETQRKLFSESNTELVESYRQGVYAEEYKKMLQQQVADYAAMNHGPNRLEKVIEYYRAVLKRRDKTANVIIGPPGSKMFLSMASTIADGNTVLKDFYNQFPLGEREGMDRFLLGPQALTHLRKYSAGGPLLYFEAEDVHTDDDDEHVRPFEHLSSFGENCLMDDPAVDKFPLDYKTSERDVRIYNEPRDSNDTVKFEDAFLHANVWDDSGSLPSTQLRQYIQGLSKSTQRDDGEEKRVQMMFVTRDDENGRMSFAHYFGQLDPNVISTRDVEMFADLASRRCAEEMGVSSWVQGWEGLKKLLSGMANQDYDREFFLGLIRVNASRSYHEGRFVGERTPPELLEHWGSEFAVDQWRTNEFGGMDLPPRPSHGRVNYPPGYQNAGGIRTLSAEKDKEGTTWGKQAEPAAAAEAMLDEWHRCLQKWLPTSELVNVANRPSWYHHPDPLAVVMDAFTNQPDPGFLVAPPLAVGSSERGDASKGTGPEPLVWNVHPLLRLGPLPGVGHDVIKDLLHGKKDLVRDSAGQSVILQYHRVAPEAPHDAQEFLRKAGFVWTPLSTDTAVVLHGKLANGALLSRDLVVLRSMGMRSSRSLLRVSAYLRDPNHAHPKLLSGLLTALSAFSRTDDDDTKQMIRKAVIRLGEIVAEEPRDAAGTDAIVSGTLAAFVESGSARLGNALARHGEWKRALQDLASNASSPDDPDQDREDFVPFLPEMADIEPTVPTEDLRRVVQAIPELIAQIEVQADLLKDSRKEGKYVYVLPGERDPDDRTDDLSVDDDDDRLFRVDDRGTGTVQNWRKWLRRTIARIRQDDDFEVVSKIERLRSKLKNVEAEARNLIARLGGDLEPWKADGTAHPVIFPGMGELASALPDGELSVQDSASAILGSRYYRCPLSMSPRLLRSLARDKLPLIYPSDWRTGYVQPLSPETADPGAFMEVLERTLSRPQYRPMEEILQPRDDGARLGDPIHASFFKKHVIPSSPQAPSSSEFSGLRSSVPAMGSGDGGVNGFGFGTEAPRASTGTHVDWPDPSGSSASSVRSRGGRAGGGGTFGVSMRRRDRSEEGGTGRKGVPITRSTPTFQEQVTASRWFNDLYTTNIRRNYSHLRKHTEGATRLFGMAFVMSRNTRDQWLKLMHNDLPVFINLLLIRPQIEHGTSAFLMMEAGMDTAFNALGNINTNMYVDGDAKTLHVHTSHWAATVIKTPQAIVRMDDLQTVYYSGGNGMDYMTHPDDILLGGRKRPSIMVAVLAYSERQLPDPLYITGGAAHGSRTGAASGQVSHFSSANYLDSFFRLTKSNAESIPRAMKYQDSGSYINVVTFQGRCWKWDRGRKTYVEVRGTGHAKNASGPGNRDVWNGGQSLFPGATSSMAGQM